MDTIYYFVLTCISITTFLGLTAFISAYSIRRYMKKWSIIEFSKGKNLPHVTIMAPQRGDIHIENIKSLMNQSYSGTWEVIFLATKDDKANQQLQTILEQYTNTRLVTATDVVHLASEHNIHRGQKCQNIIDGIEALSDKTEYLAFIDADVDPHPDWLQTLITPICDNDEEIKITTMGRLSSARGNIPAKIQSAWLLGGISLLVGPWNYVWGGSYALS